MMTYILFLVNFPFICALPVSDDHLVEFIEKKDHDVVMNALSRFMDNENVVLQALRVLIPLAAPGTSHCSLFVL